MALQVKRAGPEDYGTTIKMLIGGEPGSGKTRTSSTWPGVLYANAEGGQLSVSDRRPPSVDIDSTSVLTELHQVLTQKPEVRDRMLGTPVQTVVLDTMDEIARLYVRERLSSERKEAMAIQDWGWLGDRLRDLVRGWRNLDLNVLFLVHMKSQEDSETGRVVYKPSIQGAMGDEIAAYVDIAVLLRAQPTTTVRDGKNVRVIQRFFQTYPDLQHPWIKDRSGKLPMDFAINLDDDHARLHRFVFGEAPAASGDATATMAPPAPPPVRTQPSGPRKPPPPPVQAPPMGPDGPEPEAVAPPEPEAAGAAPEVAPEPVAVAPAPEPEPVAAEPVPEPAGDPQPSSMGVGTAVPPAEPAASNGSSANGGLQDWQICENCNNEIETKDHGDLSYIRFKQRLCRACFAERKKART